MNALGLQPVLMISALEHSVEILGRSFFVEPDDNGIPTFYILIDDNVFDELVDFNNWA